MAAEPVDLRAGEGVRCALDAVSARTRMLAAAAAFIAIVAASVWAVGVLVILDHGFEGGLPLVVRRLLALLAAVCVAGAVVSAVAIPVARRISDAYIAWTIERAHPEFRNSIMSAVQVGRRENVHPGVLLGLAQAAERDVARFHPASVVRTTAPRKSALLLCTGLLFILVYAAMSPKSVGPSLLRVLGMDVAAPTLTSVAIEQPAADASVVVGADILFEVQTRGRAPASVEIEFSLDGGLSWLSSRRLILDPDSQGSLGGNGGLLRWRAILPGRIVERTFWCRAAAGDGRSETRRVDVRPAPQVSDPVILLEYPRYTGEPPRTCDDGRIDAVVGTRVTLTARTNVPAAGASLLFRDGSIVMPRQMSIGGVDGRNLSADWIVDRDAEFEIRFSDRHGAANASPIRYVQRARPDAPPRVHQVAPAESLVIPEGGSFDLVVDAEDDFGLLASEIEFRTGPRSGHIPLGSAPSERAPVQTAIRTSIRADAFRPRPGDEIAYRVVARDNRRNFRDEPASQTGVGPWAALRIAPADPADAPPDRHPMDVSRSTPADGHRTREGSAGADSPDRARSTPGPSGAPTTATGPGKPGEDAAQPHADMSDRHKDDESRPVDRAMRSGDTPPVEQGPGESPMPGNSATGKADEPQNPRGDEPAPIKKTGEPGSEPGDDADLRRLIEANRDRLARLREALREDNSDNARGAPSDSRTPPPDATSTSDPAANDGKSGAEQSAPPSEPSRPSPEKGSMPGEAPPDDARTSPGGRTSIDGDRPAQERQPGANNQEQETDGAAGSAPIPAGPNDPADPTSDSQSEPLNGPQRGSQETEKRGDSSAPGTGEPPKSERGTDGRDPRTGLPNREAQPPRDPNVPSSPVTSDRESPIDGATGRPSNSDTPRDRPAANDMQPRAGAADESPARPANEPSAPSNTPTTTDDATPAGKPGSTPAGPHSTADGAAEPSTEPGSPRENSTPGDRTPPSSNDPGRGLQPGEASPGGASPSPAGESTTPRVPAGERAPGPDGGPMQADPRYRGAQAEPVRPLDGNTVDQTRRLIDELERRLRRGELDETALGEFGWTEADARRFVREFKRHDPRSQAQAPGSPFTGTSDVDSRPSPGDAAARRGGATARDIGTGVAPGAPRARSAEQFRERADEEVPPEYRDVLEEYYRTMARTRRSSAAD